MFHMERCSRNTIIIITIIIIIMIIIMIIVIFCNVAHILSSPSPLLVHLRIHSIAQLHL